MSSDPIIDLGVHTKESALALLKSRRHYKVECRKSGKLTNRRECAFFLHAQTDLPIADKDGHVFRGMTNIRVNFKAACKYVEDMLLHLEARGARIKIKGSNTCIFIG